MRGAAGVVIIGGGGGGVYNWKMMAFNLHSRQSRQRVNIKMVECCICGEDFARKDILSRHLKRKYPCDGSKSRQSDTKSRSDESLLEQDIDHEDDTSESDDDTDDADGEEKIDVDTVEVDSKDSQPFTLNSLDQLVKSLKSEQLSYSRIYIEHFVRNGNPEQENLGLYEEMQKESTTSSDEDNAMEVDLQSEDI